MEEELLVALKTLTNFVRQLNLPPESARSAIEGAEAAIKAAEEKAATKRSISTDQLNASNDE